jgi:hypothetical protein
MVEIQKCKVTCMKFMDTVQCKIKAHMGRPLTKHLVELAWTLHLTKY